MRRKRILVLLLILALLLPLCGCGRAETGAYRIIAVLGTRSYAVLCRKDDRLAPVLDAAMERLAEDGTLAALSMRWLGRNAITLKGAAAGDTESENAAEDAGGALPARTLIVGMEQSLNPMCYEENGALRGMSVDIADALGAALGWEVAYQPISPEEVETQLASGNIDCALGFDPGTVNSARYGVGVTYMRSDVILAARTESDIRRFRDLKEQRVGVAGDPAVTRLLRSEEQITKNAAGAIVYPTAARCAGALYNRGVAAIVVDRLMLDYPQT